MIDTLQNDLDQAEEKTKQQFHQDPTAAQNIAPTQQLQDTVATIEKDLLAIIVSRLEQNKMSPEKAQSLAKEFLSLLPIKDQQDLLTKLLKLSQDNPETKGVYLTYAKPHEENETERKLQRMSEHLHKGEIEHALAIAKGGIPHA